MVTDKAIGAFIDRFKAAAGEYDSWEFLTENARDMVAFVCDPLESALRGVLIEICSNEDFDTDIIRTKILEAIENG